MYYNLRLFVIGLALCAGLSKASLTQSKTSSTDIVILPTPDTALLKELQRKKLCNLTLSFAERYIWRIASSNLKQAVMDLRNAGETRNETTSSKGSFACLKSRALLTTKDASNFVFCCYLSVLGLEPATGYCPPAVVKIGSNILSITETDTGGQKNVAQIETGTTDEPPVQLDLFDMPSCDVEKELDMCTLFCCLSEDPKNKIKYGDLCHSHLNCTGF